MTPSATPFNKKRSYLDSGGYAPATTNYLNQDTNTSNPRTISANQQTINANAAQTAQQNAAKTQSYLDPIEQQLAGGGGGYSPQEVSQIEMSPQQQQDLVNRAGTTAGAATAAGVDAATRASNAAGGNPAAVAAYRARAAQQEDGQSADAMTNARIGAQQALAGETANVGQTRIGQQNVGLGLQSQYQNQQNQDVNSAENRAQTGVGQGLQASQTPSTFDRVMGGIGGALQFLDEGGGPSQNAVVAEGGPEAVVPMRPRYLDEGSGEAGMEGSALPTGTMQTGDDATKTPWYQKLKQSLMPQPPTSQPQPRSPMGQPQQGQSPAMQSSRSLGQGIGKVASMFLDDGYLGDGTPMEANDGAIFTKPTEVKLAPGEAAVPLGYRARAKTRPSMAMPLVNEIQGRRMYGGA